MAKDARPRARHDASPGCERIGVKRGELLVDGTRNPFRG
jgi:hypothetical protein